MKITFFKNESHFYPRISYCFENADLVNVSFNHPLRKFSQWLFVAPLIVFVFFFSQDVSKNYLAFNAVAVCCFPLHELCHAVFCWLCKRKVERISFFPYKKLFTSATAYVKPSFGVWSKKQAVLFSAFPLLLLSVVPALLSIFIPSLRTSLLFVSLCNISISHFDIVDILYLLKLPRNSLHFGDFVVTVKDIEKPATIHRLSVTPALDTIHHRCFEYFNGKLTEINQAYETSATAKLKQEFIEQFNLK